jgi:hypothetical protein
MLFFEILAPRLRPDFTLGKAKPLPGGGKAPVADATRPLVARGGRRSSQDERLR